ncbi:MAG: hypothetical protein DI551_05620 [Micavibrio aeruginosavorus]|uniref:Uncharacterized protein n=1 Tax=Micavibrio aeruginosavorus TaxID=349221 RepID=A0A2W5PNA4_9BACT|nr:MAG: hypothetical protein DI551_05620 [Micavibrio aeruginosavorus]
MTPKEPPASVSANQIDVSKIRQWTFHECDNCKAMYLDDPVTVCDCEHNADKFTKRIMIDIDHLAANGHLDKPVPDGWKLVPVEPTDDMIQAALDNCPFVIEEEDVCETTDTLMIVYKAMLSAAPVQTDGGE